jgi:uncharacterized protein (DUF1800 family)
MPAVTEPLAALVALNRFGLGARPGDLTAAAGDPRAFLEQELRKGDTAVAANLSSSEAVIQQVFALQERRKERRARMAEAAPAASDGGPQPPMPVGEAQAPAMTDMQGSDMAATPGGQTPDGAMQSQKPKKGAAGDAPNPVRQIYLDELKARFARQVQAEAGFVERLVAFWSNHFAVSAAKGQLVRAAAGAFEREAIRPHVLGRFSDMLRAVEQHPAMLFYLDNQRSTGPNSRAGRNRGKGLNENLAREILELHTLGVGGGYSQDDVTALARIITGWTFSGREGKLGEPGRFIFVANWHEPGEHRLLGKTYPQGGLAQGEAALDDLARQPSTARHVAVKLARHFVADDPPQPLVDRLASVFRDSEGDLAAVSLALIRADEAWRAPMTKMRTPIEFVVAIMRAMGVPAEKPQPILGTLRAMGMIPWDPPGPNGFPDTSDAWSSPEAMKARLDVSWRAAQQIKSVEQPLAVLDKVIGSAASPETRAAIAHAESRAQGLAILFMSPEFQRR